MRSSRSCTSCRAAIRSVPSSKISTTDDRPSTDFERSVFSPATPFIAFSSGTVTSAFDFARRKARRFGLDLDQRRRELREDVERRVLRRARAGDQQHDRQRHDDEAQPEGAFDDPAHHAVAYFPDAELDAEQLRGAVGHDARASGGPCDSTASGSADVGDDDALARRRPAARVAT